MDVMVIRLAEMFQEKIRCFNKNNIVDINLLTINKKYNFKYYKKKNLRNNRLYNKKENI